MTGWRRVKGLMMLKVYRVWGAADEQDESVVGVAAAFCLRAHRAVVVLPSASVWTKSKDPFAKGFATHTDPSSSTISASSECLSGL
jgi:hypothetical protein